MIRVAAIVLLLIAFVLTSGRASAHANLAESDPAANSVLETPPSEVTIRFTEPLEAALSEIRVLDSRGDQVDLGDSALDPTDPTVMAISLGSLDNGAYTVAWTNVSTVDGHRVRGAFQFSVGEPLTASTSAVSDEQPLLQSPWSRSCDGLCWLADLRSSEFSYSGCLYPSRHYPDGVGRV